MASSADRAKRRKMTMAQRKAAGAKQKAGRDKFFEDLLAKDAHSIRGGIYRGLRDVGADPTQAGLVALGSGYIPVVGTLSDFEDARTYHNQGNQTAAGISALAGLIETIPLGKVGATGLKALAKGLKTDEAKKAEEGLVEYAVNDIIADPLGTSSWFVDDDDTAALVTRMGLTGPNGPDLAVRPQPQQALNTTQRPGLQELAAATRQGPTRMAGLGE